MPPSQTPLVLASASPRRRALLEQLGIPLTVDPAHLDENVRAGEAAERYVLRLAREKAEAVHVRHPDDTVLAADTSVVLDGIVLGKPRDEDEALSMLRRLSGRTHEVMTAIAVAGVGGRCITAAVTFAPATEAALRWYVSTGEPMDKAGAYAVQGLGAVLIEGIRGDFFSVMGLPLRLVLDLLERFGRPYRFTR